MAGLLYFYFTVVILGVIIIHLLFEVRDRSWFISKMCTPQEHVILRLSNAARGLQVCFDEEMGRQQECIKEGVDPSSDESLRRLKKRSALCKKRFRKLVSLTREYYLLSERKTSGRRYTEFILPEDESYPLFLA